MRRKTSRVSFLTFLACAVLAGIGVALALVLLGRPRSIPPRAGPTRAFPSPAGD